MKIEQDLSQYLSKAMMNLVADVLKSTVKNPKETKFLMGFRNTLSQVKEQRDVREKAGKHLPFFLICSITDACNLFCSGCYARANGMCGEKENHNLLTASAWERIFQESADLGIAFLLLAGGEPLMRRDVITAATHYPQIVFPVFTNGTLVDDDYVTLFDKNRNIVPILSIEGDEARTDQRRGKGIYQSLVHGMEQLKRKKILFGASLTVTKENLNEITGIDFLEGLRKHGCRAVLFVEYVPVDGSSADLAIGDNERRQLEKRQSMLRKNFGNMVFLSFPGDEKKMGGCLAAGRGFFHISPEGNVEPCPFSPYGDCNVKDVSLLEAIDSPFFKSLQEKGLVGGEHLGGCALFDREVEVKACLRENDGEQE